MDIPPTLDHQDSCMATIRADTPPRAEERLPERNDSSDSPFAQKYYARIHMDV
jgi:hypothetical protein